MDRFRQKFRLLAGLSVLAFALSPLHAGQPKTNNPDLTNGGKVPAEKVDWTLGPTGLRGWMYFADFTTDQARQIAVTAVDKGSPAFETMRVGDVILGVAGKPFSKDPRVEFGEAITHAETEAGNGNLVLTRWREGLTEEVTIKIATLGSYSATAPFNCSKSKLIFEQGCKTLAGRIAKGSNKIGTIPRCMNGLALLASGNSEYLPQLKKEAEWASNFSEISMKTWYYGYVMMFLSEYILATGDTSFLPGLQRMALDAASGQSMVGSWGHTYARPDGRLQGYGMMNAPGIPLTIGLVLAREAGVKDAKVSEAIDKSLKLLRFYVGKGAIPYGDHAPWTETHEDNGKCSAAAVLFNLVGESKTAEFFTRMGVAAHGTFERETGHCGNYFNILWALPAISLAGPNASGEWMKEFGSWYFDLGRRWDGTVIHQPPPDLHENSFNGWDATGAFLLGYAQNSKKILLTGKRSNVSPMTASTARSLLDDSRGWSRKDRNSFYDRLDEKELLTRLESWSPTVRERAAAALARKKSNVMPVLLELLKSMNADSRIGACEALAAIKGKAAEAVPALQISLRDENLWVRVKAAEALSDIGQAALPVLPDLLKQLARPASQDDPRNMEQRFLTFALFNRSGLLRQGLKGVDPALLREAIVAGLKNEDGRARSDVSNIYDKLSYEELKPLLPAIYDAVIHPAPSGEMFADGVRLKGLEILAKHRIEEGIKACVDYTLAQNPWASEKRTPEIMKILVSYGARAKPMIPELKQIAELFDKGEKDFPKKLSLQKAQFVRDTIRTIEASMENPELIRLSEGASPNR